MTTKRQLEANRRNASKSTGPKSKDGKASVKLNAVKHGLTSKEILLPTEDPDEWQTFRRRILDELQPANELEAILTERVASSAWRLRRVLQVESGLFSMHYFQVLVNRAEVEAKSFEKLEGGVQSFIDEIDGHTVISDAKSYALAVGKGKRAKAETESHSATMGRAFLYGSDAFLKLSRYETAIERSLQRALRELERMRAVA